MHFSVMQLALILGIIILLFGTKKLTNVGGDVGAAIRNFRTEMKRGQSETETAGDDEKVIDVSTSSAMQEEKSVSAPFKFKKKG